ncbi:hypothetical protein K402DRAFT_433796 [Aulographum hederae CBS 113979]|uniref:J domain-containing protein n=1 Tax=Aulographum hederae CBS 113979 TaxID=1176131 RepID=A0A6G1HEH8_9PEZI|nr:hypothetical protein K402DRAFT_433796 [Aulographum hederae CBS 113979]
MSALYNLVFSSTKPAWKSNLNLCRRELANQLRWIEAAEGRSYLPERDPLDYPRSHSWPRDTHSQPLQGDPENPYYPSSSESSVSSAPVESPVASSVEVEVGSVGSRDDRHGSPLTESTHSGSSDDRALPVDSIDILIDRMLIISAVLRRTCSVIGFLWVLFAIFIFFNLFGTYPGIQIPRHDVAESFKTIFAAEKPSWRAKLTRTKSTEPLAVVENPSCPEYWRYWPCRPWACLGLDPTMDTHFDYLKYDEDDVKKVAKRSNKCWHPDKILGQSKGKFNKNHALPIMEKIEACKEMAVKDLDFRRDKNIDRYSDMSDYQDTPLWSHCDDLRDEDRKLRRSEKSDKSGGSKSGYRSSYEGSDIYLEDTFYADLIQYWWWNPWLKKGLPLFLFWKLAFVAWSPSGWGSSRQLAQAAGWIYFYLLLQSNVARMWPFILWTIPFTLRTTIWAMLAGCVECFVWLVGA